MDRRFCLFISIFAFASLFFSLNAFGSDFPGRTKYKEAAVIDIEDLYNGYKNGSVIIVDVRSDIEYSTIHVKNAKHIPFASNDFDANIMTLARQNPGKKIACYCNGTTCFKSYEAQLRASRAGVKNIYAFDLGIPGWAEFFPEETELLGKPMTQSTIKWIPKSDFQIRCLSWDNFRKMSLSTNARVIDARDNQQKGIITEDIMVRLNTSEKENLRNFDSKNKEMLEELSKKNNVLIEPLDRITDTIINKDLLKNQTLLIFDQVGKQVRWLMYQLEARGYTDYYFLDKGAFGVIGVQAYKSME